MTAEKFLAESLRVDSVVKPEDSVSCASAPEPSKASRASNASKVSKLSSRASSRGSCTALVTIARAKEAARVAELEAKIAMLEKCQTPKEKKFRVKQEETRQKLAAEIAKTSA